MTFGQDQAGEEPAMVGSQTTKLPIRNARRPNQDQNSSSSLNSVGTGSGALHGAGIRKLDTLLFPMYYAGRYPVQTRRGSPQPKYLSSAVSASDYYYRGLSDLFRGCLLVVEAISRVGCGLGSGYVCIVAGYCN